MCDILEKNLYALKSIDNLIDQDLKNTLMMFNQNISENLTQKLLNINSSYMPLRDMKFEKVLKNITKNKVNKFK